MMTVTSLPRWPRIVAEALRDVPATQVGAAPVLTGASLAEAHELLRDLQTMPRAGKVPPIFLRSDQVDPWRRVISALDQHGAALLAEGVGYGKTWIALAVAAQHRGEVVAIVPAILRGQWELAAHRAAVHLSIWTHERVSRGKLPPGQPTLVIIDEAHRLREPSTKRVQAIAPWLAGRKVLACTATPIVNRVADLAVVLHLMVPDDVLRWDGLRRIRDLPSFHEPPPALRRLIIRTATPDGRPLHPSHPTKLAITAGEIARAERGVALVDTIQGSRLPGIGSLIRNVLLDAVASSDAGLRAALLRYRALLLQAHDAGGSTRADLRRFAGAALDQLVFWSLLPAQDTVGELPLDDLAPVEHALEVLANPAESDAAWLDELLRYLSDDIPTVCFTRHTATARLLRQHLGENTAWISGSGAGIGPHRTSREAVLTAFGPDRSTWRQRIHCPLHLVATDVAAEGLDLQGAGRVIHVDLPWTATRLRQREGRLLRPGQLHDRVQIITREPAPAIARTLAPLARVNRKEVLATRWLKGVEERDHGSRIIRPAILPRCVPVVRLPCAEGTRDTVVLAIQGGSRRGLLWISRQDGGPWCPQQASALDQMPTQPVYPRVREEDLDLSLELVQSASNFALHWSQHLDRAWAPTLAWRIQHLARRAARSRDGTAMQQLDKLLHWIGSAPTLGDLLRAEALSQLDDGALLQAEVPHPVPTFPTQVYPVAAVLFRSEKSLLR